MGHNFYGATMLVFAILKYSSHIQLLLSISYIYTVRVLCESYGNVLSG